MVDKDWLAAKLTERDRLITAEKARKLREWKMAHNILVKLMYKSIYVDVTIQAKDVRDFDAQLTDLLDNGFSKPQPKGKPQAETFAPQGGVVLGVKTSERQWNGKPMFDVKVKLDDGNETIVQVFNKDSVRKNDRVKYTVSEKGYAKLEVDYGLDDDTSDDIPF